MKKIWEPPISEGVYENSVATVKYPPPISNASKNFDSNAYRSDFERLSPMLNGLTCQNVESLLQNLATTENSFLMVPLQSFFRKYWRFLWPGKNDAITGISQALKVADNLYNRESLYRLCVSIFRDTEPAPAGTKSFPVESILFEVARDVEFANQATPTDTSSFPAFMNARLLLPRGLAYITCSLALEYLILAWNDLSVSERDSIVIPLLEPEALQEVVITIMRKCHTGISLIDRNHYESIAMTLVSWHE